MHEALSYLRTLLAQTPSEAAWDSLLFYAEGWDDQEREIFGGYARNHLRSWPSQVRIFRNYSPQHLFWPLVGVLHLRLGYHGSLASLQGCEELASLHLYEGHERRYLSGLTRLTQLSEIGFYSCSAILRLDGLAALQELTSVQISWCPVLRDFRGLASLPKLKHLSIRGCPCLQELAILGELTQLEELSLVDCPLPQDLAPLAKLPHLRYLRLDSRDPLMVRSSTLLEMKTREEVATFQKSLSLGELEQEVLS
ncbi:MAG: hypothetical protein H6727_12920 [Myxococcales bacterium]|nr:hypothetical protein [Myxococcales bacterium]